MKRLFLLLCVFFGNLLVVGSAIAHPTPGSFVFIDFTVNGAHIEQDVPIEELQRALHRTLLEEGESPEQMLLRNGSLLQAYAREHLRIVSPSNGLPWTVEVTKLVGHVAEDGPRVVFHFDFRAPSLNIWGFAPYAPNPEGQAAGSVQIQDDLVAHEVVSHYTHVYVRSDWSTGIEHASPELAGVIHAGHFSVDIKRSGSFFRGLRSVVKLGVEHIASGSDHVLFVLVLLLVAPIRAVERRWKGLRTERETLLALTAVISAFTVGHSITLILGAFGWVTLSPALVEPAIAASILVTAVHALRPIFPRREVLVAGAFGLVHGLAFASTLPRQDLGNAQTAWTLFGFNAGIELGQIVLLVLVVPWILMLARTRVYPSFRVIGAAGAALLAFGWLVERIASLSNPMARPIAWLEAHPMFLLVALAVGALLARFTHSNESGSLLNVVRE